MMLTASKKIEDKKIENDINTITSHAESIKSDELQAFPVACSPGDTFRQGDIYVYLLAGLPADAVRVEDPPLQLVPGSTQGSRHCLDSLGGVTVYRLASPGDYDGPVLVVETEATITHPEHGDICLPAGIYGIGFQRTVDSEGRIRRVLD